MKQPKIKTAFAGENPDSLTYVYSRAQQQEIAELTELNPEILSLKNIESGIFAGTEILLSTWGMPPLSKEQITKFLPELKAVLYAAGATENFQEPFQELGIQISSAYQANAVPVAEFAFAQIILGLKNYFAVTRKIRETHQWYGVPTGPGAYGATVALLGSGAISTRLQGILKNLDVNVTVVHSDEKQRTVSLEEAFRTAQVVSNHLPDRASDKGGILTGAMFESMPENAVFINTGRGRQVEQQGFLEAMKKRPDITALLDVTCPEPLPEDSELFNLPNVQLSGHIAGSCNDEVHRMAAIVIEELKRYLRGDMPEHLIP